MGKAASRNSTETTLTQEHETIEQKMRREKKKSGTPLYFPISVTTQTEPLWFLREVITWDHTNGAGPEQRWSCSGFTWRPLRSPREFGKGRFSLWNQLYESGTSVLQRHQHGTFVNFSQKEPGRQRLMGLWEQRPRGNQSAAKIRRFSRSQTFPGASREKRCQRPSWGRNEPRIRHMDDYCK